MEFEIRDWNGGSIEFHVVELNQKEMSYNIVSTFEGLLHLKFTLSYSNS